MKNGSCSAATVAGSAALPFVISTGGVMGLRPTQGDEKTGPVQQLLLLEAPPSPLSSRPEESWAFGPPKAMKAGLVQQLLLLEAPPSPLSSRPERSVVERSAVSAVLPWAGEVKAMKRVLFSNYCCWQRRPPLCPLDRSAA